jgi:hypothetical protein
MGFFEGNLALVFLTTLHLIPPTYLDRRLKISGAQWLEQNVSQVLKHRCAYLNAQL